MKTKLTAAFAAALSSSMLFAASAHAQSAPASGASAPAAKHAVKPVHHAEPAKSASAPHHEAKRAETKHAETKHAETKRKPFLRKKTVAAVPAVAQIPDGADKWSCAEDQTLYIKGDMKRDQILTMYYDGKDYKLPRIPTTTGADRFHDLASGMDLVVIPTKAMLFSDKDDDRLADECMTEAMIHNNELAPTQSNAISKQR